MIWLCTDLVSDCGLSVLTGSVQAVENDLDMMSGPVLQVVEEGEQQLGRLQGAGDKGSHTQHTHNTHTHIRTHAHMRTHTRAHTPTHTPHTSTHRVPLFYCEQSSQPDLSVLQEVFWRNIDTRALCSLTQVLQSLLISQ